MLHLRRGLLHSRRGWIPRALAVGREFTMAASEALSSASSPTPTPTPAPAPAPAPTPAPAPETEYEWAVISGFTKFAARRDLDVALGENIKPLKVEAIVDQLIFFQGAWLLCLDPAICSVDRLRKELSRPRAVFGEPVQPNALVGASTERLAVKRVRYPAHSPSRGGIGKGENIKPFTGRLASQEGITGCTLRLRNVAYNLSHDALMFFFRDFRLGPRGIEKLKIDARFNQYLVHFKTPTEAEKAMSLLNLKVANGSVMHMIWYSCCL